MLHKRVLLLLVVTRVLNVIAQHLSAEIHVRLVQMLMIVVYDVIIVERGRDVGRAIHAGVRVNVIIVCI